MTRAIVVLLGLLALPAWAQSDGTAELAQLRLDLTRIQQEQQAVYQQFQMVQELRKQEVQAQSPQVITNPPVYPDGEPPNYDDIARAQQEREYRLKDYSAEADRLYARYKELEEEKRPIRDRMRELAGQR